MFRLSSFVFVCFLLVRSLGVRVGVLCGYGCFFFFAFFFRQVYSYSPDMDGDPFTEGCLWSFNHFFFNKSLKRVLFLHCTTKRWVRCGVGSGECCWAGFRG